MAMVWACPFWTWDDGRSIHCEGGSRIRLPDDVRREYAAHFCRQDWRSCPIARHLLMLYEREESDRGN